MPSLPEPVKLVLVRGAQAFAWFAAGRLAEAAEAAAAAEADARRLGFEQHFSPWITCAPWRAPRSSGERRR